MMRVSMAWHRRTNAVTHSTRFLVPKPGDAERYASGKYFDAQGHLHTVTLNDATFLKVALAQHDMELAQWLLLAGATPESRTALSSAV